MLIINKKEKNNNSFCTLKSILAKLLFSDKLIKFTRLLYHSDNNYEDERGLQTMALATSHGFVKSC